jgi:hypothetical protein
MKTLKKRIEASLKNLESGDWTFNRCASYVVEVMHDDMNDKERDACWTIILYCKRKESEAQRLTTPLISFRPDLAPIRTDFLPDRGYFVDECASWGRKQRTCAVADG